MSQANAQPLNSGPKSPGPPEPPASPSDRAQRRARPQSWLARVIMQTLGRWGALMGLAWIVTMAFFAIFAPLLASSHPIVMTQADGDLSMPIFEALQWIDVTLLIATLAAGVLWVPGISRAVAGKRFLIWLTVLVVTAGVSFLTVSPPKNVVLSQYREGLASGEIESAVFTIVPYSAIDAQRDRGDMRLNPPSAQNWLGTDATGYDLLSRMIHACRIALAIGFIATGIAVVIGCAIGALMGYFSGIVDLLGMRLVEIFSAIPTIFLLIAITAFYGRNLYLMMIIIGLTGWVGYALFVRAEFLKLRKQDYVQAAIACGVPLPRVLLRHMLPNGLAPVLVTASFGIAGAILTESTLSFLGLGLVEEPSWGQMLNQARGVGGALNWWIAVFPGVAIFLTVFAYNLIGEALRDALDPKAMR